MGTKERLYPPEVHRTALNLHPIEQLCQSTLEGESYEDAAAALESVESLQEFRKKTSQLPFGSFHELIEEVTNLNKLPLSSEEREKRVEVLAEALEQKAVRFSPRVADLFLAMIAEVKGQSYQPQFDMTGNMINDLRQKGDLWLLFSGQTSWKIKLNRIETRLSDYLLGVRDLDRRERKEMDDDIRKWREEELKKAPTHPPERQNESKPGVDPMERLKEGERAPAIWSIFPAWVGYYREQSFSRWDGTRNVWVEDEYVYKDAETVPLSGNKGHKKGPIDIEMSAKVFTGSWVTLPVPYTHGLHKIEAGGRRTKIRQDQNGDLVIFIEGSGEVEIKSILAPHPGKKFKSDPNKIVVPEMPAEFSEETNNKLEEIKNKKQGNIARARAIAAYVRGRIKYLAPKDRIESERYNTAYNTHPKGFAGAVDELRAGDCDVANTYFAALCAKLDIPVRHVVGHRVKGKDKEGFSSIHSGTGHAWSEVWDGINKEWVIIDATPQGDPNIEEDQEQEGESAPGDYGEQEALKPSDEELEKLRQKLAEHKEKLSYTREERKLAEKTGIELKEARQIVKEINEAEQTRLPNGEPVVDALTRIFNAIVESRKITALTYEGPVRRREGGERIIDIVRHKVGMMAGETDPLSRKRVEEETKEEKIIGGFDLYIVGDKSGSMQSITEAREKLWQMQRRAIYLIISALHRFERNIERAGLPKENALSVRTQVVSFCGDNPEDIDLDKPLSSTFTEEDKVKLWHSLTTPGSANGDVEALAVIYGQIKKEIAEAEKHGLKDNRLRLVIACSDGGYVGAEGQMRAMAEALHKLNVIVVGIGLTETAASVPVVMENPPVSRGDIVGDINDLPALVAKYVVLEAIKLFPQKALEDARQIIENSISKFKSFE